MNIKLYGWASVQSVDQPFHDDLSFGEMHTKEQQETKHSNEQRRALHQPSNHPENMDLRRLSTRYGDDDNADTTRLQKKPMAKSTANAKAADNIADNVTDNFTDGFDDRTTDWVIGKIDDGVRWGEKVNGVSPTALADRSTVRQMDYLFLIIPEWMVKPCYRVN